MQGVFGCNRVCDKGKLTGGTYGSCHLKHLCEDRVLEFDILANDDVFVYLIYIYGIYRIGNHKSVFALLEDQYHVGICYLT